MLFLLNKGYEFATIRMNKRLEAGNGSDPDPGPSYTWRTLTDPSGVQVTTSYVKDRKTAN